MKSKITKKVFVILLIFAIACSFGITTYAARDFSDRVGDPTATVYEQAPAGEEVQRIGEITRLRDERSETHLLSDGRLERVLYCTDKHYVNEDGEYEEIDHSLVRITRASDQPPGGELTPVEPEETVMAEPELPAEETADTAPQLPSAGIIAESENAAMPAEESAAENGEALAEEAAAPAADETAQPAGEETASEEAVPTETAESTEVPEEDAALPEEPVAEESSAPQYSYKNASGKDGVYFADGQVSALRIDNGEMYAALLPRGACETQAVVGDQRNAEALQLFAILEGNSITYPGIYESTDFVYTVGNEGVKEYIILQDENAPLQFTFSLAAPGLSAATETDGTVRLTDESGAEVYRLGRLFAMDAAGRYTEDIHYSLGEDAAGPYITVTLSEFYAAESTYPIVIDPSVMITGQYVTYDTYAAANYSGTNFYMSTLLNTGTTSSLGETRTYIKFDLPTDIPASSVSESYLYLERSSGTTTQYVKAYRVMGSWSSSTLTWNNRPNYSASYASDNAVLGYGTTWYKMYVTTIVRGQMMGHYSNYGFVLVEGSNSCYTVFYSSDADSPHKPELYIVYNANGANYGCRPYQVASGGNCFSYALNYPSTINNNSLGISDDELIGAYLDRTVALETGDDPNTASYLLEIYAYAAETWMNSHGISYRGGYGSGYTYNSPSLAYNEYRIVLRVGIWDRSAGFPNRYDGGSEDCDMHWLYQTSTGTWAGKGGTNPSEEVSYIPTGGNPSAVLWPHGGGVAGYNYSSQCVYYIIST